MANNQSYLKRLINSFGYAFNGIGIFFKETRNAKIHALAAVLAILMGWVFHISKFEWLAIIGCIAMVFVAEAFNSAIEYNVDLATQAKDPLAKKAKDVAAAAVLLASIAALIIGLFIFLPRIQEGIRLIL
ncbi:MAG: diacylglycerol kinase family protein [Bacteroidetes bacterium]|nr:diacylglycerol kinase family protein [Bacteroidota bacterium]